MSHLGANVVGLSVDIPSNPSNFEATYLDKIVDDRRIDIRDTNKIKSELLWQPSETFETGIKKTVQWYLDHQEWVKKVTGDNYHHWINKHYK